MSRVLVLSPYPERLAPVLIDDDWIATTEPLSEELVAGRDWLISFGYRHIIREPWLSRFVKAALNLHISHLPWNRGADPNFWSWADDTQKGVSLHVITAGLDTGPIVAQRLVEFPAGSTLRTSHDLLMDEAVSLFHDFWQGDDVTNYLRFPQGLGSYHRASERLAVWDRFPLGWDTPVADITSAFRPPS